jgi:DNA-binding MarR family transcriptional regulator
MKAKTSECVKFSDLIGRLIRSLSLLERDQKVCCGTTMSQCYTIEALARERALSMHELSRNMGVTMSTMTRVIDILVRDGVVDRKSSSEDRRIVCVELTAKGTDLARKLRDCADDYSKQILNLVPAEHRAEVVKSLVLLADAVDKVRCGECRCSSKST